jgi:hypothetical protein
MAVDQQAVRTAIGVAQSAVRGDDVVAAAATVRSARLAGPDAVRFLRHLVRDDAVAISHRTRVACALLEVGGFLGGGSSAETRSSTAVREAEGDGASGRDAA